jgi:hypothetical protein
MIVVATRVEFVEPGQREVHRGMENKKERLTLSARERPQSLFGNTRMMSRTAPAGRTDGLPICWRPKQNALKPNREELCVIQN